MRSGDIGQISSPGQYLAWGMANVLVGTVEVARGRFGAAAPRMEETVAALAAESAASWSFPAGMLLAQSHCVLGNVDAGAKNGGRTARQGRPPRGRLRAAIPPCRGVACRRGRAHERGDITTQWKRPTWPRTPVNGPWRCLPCMMRPGSATSRRCSDSSASRRISAGGLPQFMPRMRPPCWQSECRRIILRRRAIRGDRRVAVGRGRDRLKPLRCSGRLRTGARPRTRPRPPTGSPRPAGVCRRRLWSWRRSPCR